MPEISRKKIEEIIRENKFSSGKNLIDEDLIEDLNTVMRDASICGLGQAAPNPITLGLRYFKEEFE